MEKTTSPAVIVLMLAGSAAILYAYWLSIRQDRCFRRLVTWIDPHHAERWRALNWVSRNLNLRGGVEYLRRHGLAEDPEFMALYRACKRDNLRLLFFILVGFALIVAVPLGVRYLGWNW